LAAAPRLEPNCNHHTFVFPRQFIQQKDQKREQWRYNRDTGGTWLSSFQDGVSFHFIFILFFLSFFLSFFLFLSFSEFVEQLQVLLEERWRWRGGGGGGGGGGGAI